MISSPKKLSCKYIYLKVVNFIQYIYKLWPTLYQNINVYIFVCMFTHVYDGLSWLETNILIPKFGLPNKKS